MQIKLRALRLPFTDGILLQEDSSTSGADFEKITNGLSIEEIYYQDKTGVLQGERLGTEHNVWISETEFANRTLIRGDKLYINLEADNLDIEIDSIIWQSDNIVRITLTSGSDIESIQKYIKVFGASNTANNGLFSIIDRNIGSLYLDIHNEDRTNADADESDSPAKLRDIDRFTEFEIQDIQRKLFSQFERHYELNIFHPND
ncbi:MAG: hypothetical protein ACFFDH_00065 [Promethearchaeota archaeon]